MAFEEVASLDADTVISVGGFNKKTKKDNPTSAEGYYLGSKKVQSAKAKNGVAYLHILQTAKGNLGVWGKTDMDKKLLQVTPGVMVRITHTGMKAVPTGEMYVYKVEIDSSNKLEGYTAPAETTTSGVEDGEALETAGETENEQSEAEVAKAELEAAETAARAAAQRAKVQALLNKNKSK